MGVAVLRSSLFLSLAIHAALIACLLLFNRNPHPVVAPTLTWIEIEPSPTVKSPRKEEALRRQIVQTEKGEKSDVAKENALLGEATQRVDRESVSRTHHTAIGRPTARMKEQRNAERQDSGNSKEVLGKFGVAIIPSTATVEGAKELKDQPEWADQASSPQDFVKGIRESDRTALNTKEFVFYGYFQRIRERLDRAWVPILRERLVKMYRTGRRLATDMDHTTRVLVVLNATGEIVKVRIMGESGVRDLDDAAVRAFNQAGPFPNPPRGIADPNGEIQIPWEFVLKT